MAVTQADRLELDPLGVSPGDATTVLTTLRKRIVSRHYPPGVRLAEIPVAEALGVSRTPVRLAFRTLEKEGLLEIVGKRGYAVRAFSEADVLCALEVRGALEGLAARRLAQRGLTTDERDVLSDCLDAGEAVVSKGRLEDGDIGRWAALNDLFHRTIVDANDSRVIADALARNDHLPFASATSIIIDPAAMDKEFRKLQFAQLQHRLVVDALLERESARVEMLMREHAYVGLRYGKLFGLGEQQVSPE